MSDVRLLLRHPTGTVLQPNMPVDSLDWVLQENTFGVLHASGPVSQVDRSYFQEDARLEVLRSVSGGEFYNEGDTQFLLRYWDFEKDETGTEYFHLEAWSLDCLLPGWFVDYDASTETVTNAYTTKTNFVDDMLKEIVLENMGSSATNAARILAELTVEADFSNGPATTRSFSRRVLLDLFQEIADDSAAHGVSLSFGLVRSGSSGIGIIFRTWTGQRGIDHTLGSGDPIIISEALHNLRLPKLSFDFRTEYTSITNGGTGLGDMRIRVRVEDVARSTASPLSYREKFVDGTDTADLTILTAAANGELERSRPIIGFTGKFIDTDYARYGERLFFGDKITIQHEGYQVDCRLDRVAGKWSRDGGEELDIRLKG